MAARLPPGSAPGPAPEDVEGMLRDVREALRMDVAFVSRFAGDRLVFSYLGQPRAPRTTIPLRSVVAA